MIMCFKKRILQESNHYPLGLFHDLGVRLGNAWCLPFPEFVIPPVHVEPWCCVLFFSVFIRKIRFEVSLCSADYSLYAHLVIKMSPKMIRVTKGKKKENNVQEPLPLSQYVAAPEFTVERVISKR